MLPLGGCRDGLEKPFRIKSFFFGPEAQQGPKDFTLSVQPGMSLVRHSGQGLLIGLVNGSPPGFQRGEDGPIADGFEHAVAAAVQALPGQWFAIAGTFADAQAAVTEELFGVEKRDGVWM